MTTTRELCRVLATALHVPGVERWAEQLVDRELLPGLDHKVTTLDAALLLAAVVAAPNPEDAPHAVVTLANLPRMSTMCRVPGSEIETWARCTDADRAAMPDDPLDALAKEIEDTPENLEYGQLTRAQKGMRGISAEMRFVVNTPDLPTLQRHAVDLTREMSLRPKINRLRRSKAWGNLGDLKRELLDLWTEERNTLAKAVMQDIEAQRKQRRAAK